MREGDYYRRKKLSKDKNKIPERKKDSLKITRRELLGLIGASAFMILAGKYLRDIFSEKKPEKSEEKEYLEKLSEIEKNNNRYSTEDLQIEKPQNGGILSEAYSSEDSTSALVFLWNKKIERVEKSIKNLEKRRKIKTAAKLKERINKFKELQKKSSDMWQREKGFVKDLNEFEEYLNLCTLETLSNFDIDKFLNTKKYNEDKILSIKKFLFLFFLQIHKFLINIIITEVCHLDKEDPKENFKILTFILRKHGLTFLSFIPALHDNLVSFGPFQLTPLVINPEDEENIYPITYMNKFLKENHKLPNNLEEFRVRDHYKAEILLSLYYVADILKTTKILDNIESILSNEENLKWFLEQIFYYLAGAHHYPSPTKENFENFMEKFFTEQFNQKTEKESFLNYIKESSEHGKYIKRFDRYYSLYK